MTRTHFVSRPFSYNLCALAALALGACAAPGDELPAREFVLEDAGSPTLSHVEPDGTPRMRAAASPTGDAPEDPPETPDEPELEPEPEQVPPWWDGDFVATDDVQMEAFCVGGFTSVAGDVALSGDVTDPSALDCLEVVKGGLSITFAPGIARMDAFNNLTEVHGDLRIANLAGLELLLGFDSLAVLDGSLEIEENAALREMNIAATLPEVQGDVMVRWNEAAQVVQLLPEAWRIDGNLMLDRFGAGEELPYFAALVVVGGDVQVLDNPDVQTVASLFSIERIDGNLVIDENPALGNENAEDAGDVMADRVGGTVVLGRNGE